MDVIHLIIPYTTIEVHTMAEQIIRVTTAYKGKTIMSQPLTLQELARLQEAGVEWLAENLAELMADMQAGEVSEEGFTTRVGNGQSKPSAAAQALLAKAAKAGKEESKVSTSDQNFEF
jgi:hypothetical protein